MLGAIARAAIAGSVRDGEGVEASALREWAQYRGDLESLYDSPLHPRDA